jgi:TPR repeat protein
MRSLPALAAALSTCAIVLPSFADPSPRPSAVVAVLDFRSAGADPAALTDRVRRAAKEALPLAALVSREETHALLPDLMEGCAGSCAVRAGRMLIADLVVSGEVTRKDGGLVLSLELRETREGDLVGTATAKGANAEELAGAAATATADLFRPLSVPASASSDPGKARAAEPAAFAVGTPQLPAPPGPLGPVPEGLTVDYDVDADVLVLYDQARTADVAGAEHPEGATRAWNALAQAPGENPFRSLASERGEAWDAYAAKQRAYEAQRAADSSRLRKVLPLKWVSDWVKLDLLERYARSYGAESATQLVPAARPVALREKASLALACEQDADKCLALARLADDANEPRVAVAYLDRACVAGSTQACSDAGNRFLTAPTRDVERALSALQRGCEAKAAQACARLARVYEEGDGAKVDLAAAADLRDKACAAGDGPSCRRLACLIDTSASQAAKAKAEELWSNGCSAGDAQSCALVRAASALKAGPPPPASDIDAATSAREYSLQRRQSLGIGLLAIGTVLGTGAAAIAFDRDGVSGRRRAFADRRSDRETPTMAYVLGAGAAVSVGVGLGILLSKPEPEAPRKVTVGIAPGAVLLSGPIP